MVYSDIVSSNGDKIGSFTAKDNGKEYSKTFHGLSTDTYYYFRLDKTNWLNQAVVKRRSCDESVLTVNCFRYHANPPHSTCAGDL